MARIRSIKPSFFRSEDVSALPMRARLTWIGLWTQCDDQGRTKDNTRLIKGDIWPLDNVTLADVEEDLSTLAAHGRIVRYEVRGKRYLEIVNWSEHQKIDRPTASVLPGPDDGTIIANHRRGLDEDSTSQQRGLALGKEGKGEEGNTRTREAEPSPSQEPPTRCQKHLATADPPACGKCADARRANDAWHTAKARRVANAPECKLHRGQLAAHCAQCRSEELNPA